jgi:hypothetical protein
MIAQEQLDAFAAAIITTYESNSSGIGKCKIAFEPGLKYIRVVRSTTEFDRSVHSFIEVETGDIWKAASWKTPAKNKPRGNVAKLTPNVTNWTGAS